MFPERVDNLCEFFVAVYNCHKERGFNLVGYTDQAYGRNRIVLEIYNDYECDDGSFKSKMVLYYSSAHKIYDYDEKLNETYFYLALISVREFLYDLKQSRYFNLSDPFIEFLHRLKYLIYINSRKYMDELAEEKRKEQRQIEYQQQDDTDPEPEQFQKTYLMLDNHLGYYKIGKSFNPEYREKTLMAQKPSIQLIWIYEKDIEDRLHSKFQDKRVRGEWFALTSNDLNYFKRLRGKFISYA